MWVYLALVSALFLGFYDIFKKKSLSKNSVMWVLFSVSVLSTIFLAPFFKGGEARDFLLLVPKGFLVTLSWISGLIAMKNLPLTTTSTIKASRPVFVLIFSIILFAERLSGWQWCGVLLTLVALWMLSRSSRKEGIYFTRNIHILWMWVSVASGAASALYDNYVIDLLDPVFVQCWSNLYIGVLMGIVLLVKQLRDGSKRERFRWDWMLPATAAVIVIADAFYFFALKDEEAMLSITSLIRRCSVIVTFAGSAIIFRENHIREKAIDLAVLLAGITILVLTS